MKIGVDMDGVIANLTPHLIDFHNHTYNTAYNITHHSIYDLTKIWQCSSKEVIKRVHKFYDSVFFHKFYRYQNQKGISYLSKNHSLILITSRPHFVENHSKAWLDKHFPNQFSKIVHTNQITQSHEKKKKKSDICKEEKVGVMIEDALEYALDCAVNGIKVLLVDSPWNQKNNLHPKIKRVFNWKEIILSI
jgi:uncharacterized HAD superfamily protein